MVTSPFMTYPMVAGLTGLFGWKPKVFVEKPSTGEQAPECGRCAESALYRSLDEQYSESRGRLLQVRIYTAGGGVPSSSWCAR